MGADEYRKRVLSAEELVGKVRSGNVVEMCGGSGLPNLVLQALTQRAARELDNVLLHHPMRRNAIDLDPDPVSAALAGHLFHVSDFTFDAPIVEAIRAGRATYRPNQPSEGAATWAEPIDWLVVTASPMDKHGFFSLGAFGGWAAPYLAKNAKHVVLEVNPHQPRVLGPCMIHLNAVDYIVEADYPLVHVALSEDAASPIETAIAEHIASLIDDGSTLQIGAGTIPDAVARLLVEKRDLGVHSELLSDWTVKLYECGVITGKQKTLHPGRIIAAMALGSKAVYEFIDDNPLVEIHPISYTNDTEIIRRNAKQISINASMEIDLMGQCASESIGPLHYSGTGGQWEFHRGAALSPGGKGIIALTSTAKNGKVSRIVPMLRQGAAVSIPRNDVHYVVTEYGIALLKGKSLRQRAQALIAVAHPDFRKELLEQAKHLKY